MKRRQLQAWYQQLPIPEPTHRLQLADSTTHGTATSHRGCHRNRASRRSLQCVARGPCCCHVTIMGQVSGEFISSKDGRKTTAIHKMGTSFWTAEALALKAHYVKGDSDVPCSRRVLSNVHA